MKKTLSVLSLFGSLIFAQDKIEEKLADAIAKANRGVSHADAKAQKAGQNLESHCLGKGQHAGIRSRDGLWGCVTLSTVPMNPPGTAR